MRRVIRWFTSVIPLWGAAIAIAWYTVMVSIALVLQYFGATEEELKPFLRMRISSSVIAMGFYALYRVAYFHPHLNQSYGTWLSSTPWHWGKPLPLGPVQLVPQDVLVVGVAALMSHGAPPLALMMLPVIFLCGYLFLYIFVLQALEMSVSGLVLAFGLGGIVWVAQQSPLSAITTGLALYLFLFSRMPQMFQSFPWDEQKAKAKASQEFVNQRLGWPIDLLSPRIAPTTPLWKSIIWPILIGWWTFAILTNLEPEAKDFVVHFSSVVLPAPILFGTMAVISRFRSPISLWGRIWTLRWIVPRYDIVFVPLVLTFVVIVFCQALMLTIAPKEPVFPLLVSAVFLILALALRLRDWWRLTSPARMAPGGYVGKEFEHL